MKNVENFNLLGELSDNEIENFFDKDYETIFEWREGEGRGTSNYEILKSGNVYIRSAEHYGFDDYAEKIYHFITMKNNNHEESYGVFCMTDRMLAMGYKIDGLDIFWSDAIIEYAKFLDSEFNVDTKSELECIDEYFRNK